VFYLKNGDNLAVNTMKNKQKFINNKENYKISALFNIEAFNHLSKLN